MVESDSPLKRFIHWIAPNAIWDVIKWIGGSSMITSVGHLCWLELHRAPVDWYWLAGLFGVGVILIVVAAIVQPRHPANASIPKVVEEPRPKPRLEILSAHWGVEGVLGGDPDKVDCLLERQTGNIFTALVCGDLFHGSIPAPGKLRLKVEYSFDGHKATTVRQDGEYLMLPEDQFLVRELDQIKGELRRVEVTHNAELARAQECYRQCMEEKKESANRNLEYRAKLGLFSGIQWEALQLANDLTDFLKELGAPPAPKYSYEEIQRMPLAESRRLIEENDGDFAEACEYHNGKGSMRLTEEGLYKQLVSHNLRMWPWYDKVQASYEERFAPRVQSVQRQFVIAGIPAGALGLAIDGPDGTKNIRATASKLWELSYKLKEKELPNDKDPRLP